ncbi:MAG: DUF2459 domain-containing protein [Planctomycetes bacterium]|nr:DUF2459 domain-containing protein [Planctomycetota bacterium]
MSLTASTRPGPRCRQITLSEAQYLKRCGYLLASFVCDVTGQPQRIDHAGYTPYDRFFESNGSYSLITTCNEWTGAGLRGIGVRAGCWTPFAGDVLRPLPE